VGADRRGAIALGENLCAAEGALGDAEREAARPDIDLFINAGPVAAARVPHMCAYIHRFIPALHLARDMIADGTMGGFRHYRSQLLLNMEELALTWRFSRGRAGGGATGDLGSHHIDLARFLVAEVTEIAATTRTWSTDPAGHVTGVNDDSFSAIAHLSNGALATFEGSRLAPGNGLDRARCSRPPSSSHGRILRDRSRGRGEGRDAGRCVPSSNHCRAAARSTSTTRPTGQPPALPAPRGAVGPHTAWVNESVGRRFG
jgi:hypothetical protein